MIWAPLFFTLFLFSSGNAALSEDEYGSEGNIYRHGHRIMRNLLVDKFDPVKFGKCLDKYQYPFWRAIMKQKSCRQLTDSFEEYMEKMKILDSEGTKGMQENLFSFIRSPHNSKFLCDVLNKQLVPCVKAADKILLAFFHDRGNCFPNGLVPKDYKRKDFWRLLENLSNALCAENSKKDNQRCGVILMDNIIGEGEYEPQKVKVNGLQTLTQCNDKLGCCGVYVKNVGIELNKFNFKPFLPEVGLLTQFIASSSCNVTQGCKPDFTLDEKDRNDLEGSDALTSEEIEENERHGKFPEVKEYSSTAPQQVHLALAGKDENGRSNEMAVMWVTNEKADTIVKYGTSKIDLALSATGTSTTYNDIPNLKNVPLNVTYNHLVHLKDLKPSTVYYYQCGSDKAMSEIFQFNTSANTFSSFSVGIFGDLGLFESKEMIDKLNELSNLDFIYHIGDISYADNWPIHNLITFGYETVWNKFMNLIQPIASVKPYMVLPGNHESDCHDGVCMSYDKLKYALANFTAYNNRFHMPSQESNGVANMWYSFNYGNVHFIAINSETDFPHAPLTNYSGTPVGNFGNQVRWLERDLREATRKRKQYPWIIALGHRPVYSIDPVLSEKGTPRKAAAHLQNFLEPLFEKYGVDMYIAGHQHCYERQSPIYNSKKEMTEGSTDNLYKDPRHTMYIVHGAAGNEEFITPQPKDVPEWSIVRNDQDYGVGILRVMNDSVLQWDFVSAFTGNVLDVVTIDASNRVFQELEFDPVLDGSDLVDPERKEPVASSSSLALSFSMWFNVMMLCFTWALLR